MFLRLSSRAAPILLLVLSTLWMAWTVFPLFYSLLFPNADIQHIVRALEDREALRGDLAPLTEQVTSSVGRLKRAVQIAAYWGTSAEYKVGQSHTAKTTELSYLAWFEKRSKPTILVVTRTEVDGSRIRFDINEGGPFGMLRFYLVPAVVLGLSIWWSVRKRSQRPRVEADHRPAV
jgi:hypothetical protein